MPPLKPSSLKPNSTPPPPLRITILDIPNRSRPSRLLPPRTNHHCLDCSGVIAPISSQGEVIAVIGIGNGWGKKALKVPRQVVHVVHCIVGDVRDG